MFFPRPLALSFLIASSAVVFAQDATTPPQTQGTPPTPNVQAQTDVAGNTVPGYVMQTPPKIDGIIEDAEWSGVPTFSGLVDASNGGNVPYQGTFWLGYDTKYIYF